MALNKVVQTFTGGYNGDASPFVLDTTKVSAVRNMLFERGLLISRPGLTSVAMSATSAPYSGLLNNYGPYFFGGSNYGFTKHWDGVTPFVNTTLRKVWRRHDTNTYLSDTDVSLPAGYIFAGNGSTPEHFHLSHCWFSQNGVSSGVHVLGGFRNAGLNTAILMVTNAGVATGIELPNMGGVSGGMNSLPVFLVTHLSRVLAAYADGNAIAWCKIGDVTVWSGHFTAGNAVLPEVDDGITGLAIVRNVIVIPRRYGFHLGVATGDGANPYDWKKFSGRAKGCYWPHTFAQWKDEVFFVSEDNVHRFDLNQITDVGEGITSELFTAIDGGVANADLVGFVTRSYKHPYRPQYHVFRTITPGAGTTTPFAHFVYDITEGAWSRHTYDGYVTDNPPLSACALNTRNLNNTAYKDTVCLLRRSTPALVYWDPSVACESTQSFTTGRVQLGDPTEEFTLVRLLVVAYCSTAATACSATFNSMLGSTATDTTVNFTLGAGWQRVWVNTVKVGQFFTVTINIPAGVYVEFRQLVLVHTVDGGELRV